MEKNGPKNQRVFAILDLTPRLLSVLTKEISMYAVIFKATINKLDDAYSKIALRMRELAINEYGCSEFVSVTGGDQEISISYLNKQEDIISWKQNSEHLAAQELGKSGWYKYYQVQVVEIISEYKVGCK